MHHWLEFQDLLQKAVPNNLTDRNEVQCLLIFILYSMKEIAQETMKDGVTGKRLDWKSKDPNSESSILVLFSLWEINRLFSSDFPWFSSEDIVFATIVALI